MVCDYVYLTDEAKVAEFSRPCIMLWVSLSKLMYWTSALVDFYFQMLLGTVLLYNDVQSHIDLFMLKNV